MIAYNHPTEKHHSILSWINNYQPTWCLDVEVSSAVSLSLKVLPRMRQDSLIYSNHSHLSKFIIKVQILDSMLYTVQYWWRHLVRIINETLVGMKRNHHLYNSQWYFHGNLVVEEHDTSMHLCLKLGRIGEDSQYSQTHRDINLF